MTEQEKKSGGAGGGSSVVLVEQTGTRLQQPFRRNELQDETPDLPHKRSRAPAVSSVTEELKENANSEGNDRREYERAMSSEKQKLKQNAKKLSSGLKRRGSSPETLPLSQLEVDTKKGTTTPPVIVPAHPIPEQVPSTTSADSDVIAEKANANEENDSITDEIAELRTPEVAKKTTQWSDEEEAGGLPRCESRASRMSRAVRQLLCCGVRLETPSEHAVSPRGCEGI